MAHLIVPQPLRSATGYDPMTPTFYSTRSLYIQFHFCMNPFGQVREGGGRTILDVSLEAPVFCQVDTFNEVRLIVFCRVRVLDVSLEEAVFCQLDTYVKRSPDDGSRRRGWLVAKGCRLRCADELEERGVPL